eukprot:CAMPEP_0117691284 /NCGR_PEP_ID=MMETSP0804-20121206/25625_1 /TAXON_ID=1074897 /ORGANISM="Tetraselmis astigmatica, Strain CCMP880" /LENGTH=998 /DNA_ID=CAMNT_0005504481 /DNA_START=114 /DNA_END=3110 /DNA_ORIENTATION=-
MSAAAKKATSGATAASNAQLDLLRASLAAAGQQASVAPQQGRGGSSSRGGKNREKKKKGEHQDLSQAEAPPGSGSGAEPSRRRGGKQERSSSGTGTAPIVQEGGESGGAQGVSVPGKQGGRCGRKAPTGKKPEEPAEVADAGTDPEGSSGVANGAMGNRKKKNKARTKRARFQEHWLQAELQAAMKKGEVFRAPYRCNANNSREGFVSIDGLGADILIKGISNQNRAIVGDEVAVLLLPKAEWHNMQSSSSGTKEEAGGSDKFEVNDPEAEEDGEEAVESPDEESLPASGSPPAAKGPAEVVAECAAHLLANPHLRLTGRIVAILSPSPRRELVVGSMMSEANGVAFLVPSDPRLPKMMVKCHTLPGAIKEALLEDCQKASGEAHLLVSARVVEWTASNLYPLAQVRESIGQAGEIETETAAVLAAEGIVETGFSQDVIDCLPSSPWEVPKEELARRRDLRSTRIFTIDPLTARDLDDALSVEPIEGGLLRIGVHIADVSHFVLPNTALDEEACSRSTSVYLVQRVLPMLPHLLCQELCSLNPGVDRLAFSIIWDITPDGDIVGQWMGRTVIRSCVKLAYEHAQRIIDGTFTAQSTDEEPIPSDLQAPYTWQEVVSDVLRLNSVARRLRAARFDAGALRLDNVKLSFKLNKDGNPVSATPYVQREANQMIEEFMLLANRRVAEFISQAFPDRALLRRHPPPDPRQLQTLEESMTKMGISMDTSSSGALHASLVALRGVLEPSQVDIIIQQATKPMQLAEYFCTGTCMDCPMRWRHYALAMSHYTHFTSPIRRYPDVIVHRLVEAALAMEGGASRDDAIRQQGLRGREEAQEVARRANSCKLAAKNVQDASLKVYLCVMLRAAPTIMSATLLPMGGNQYFNAYVGDLGVQVCVQVSEIHGCREADFNTQTRSLWLLPGKPRGGSKEAEVGAADELGGWSYGLSNISNPGGLRPVALPLELRPLQSVPVVLTSALSGSGRPSSVLAKLYTVAEAAAATAE